MKSTKNVSSQKRYPICLVLFPCLILSALGCSKSPYELAPARGRVTLDGKPLENAKVMFAPIAKGESTKAGKPAFARLQSDGEFILGTYAPEDGAVVGEHWVTVIRLTENKEPQRRDRGKSKATPVSFQQPWSRVTYPERMTVAADADNEFSISLTSEMAAKYGQLND